MTSKFGLARTALRIRSRRNSRKPGRGPLFNSSDNASRRSFLIACFVCLLQLMICLSIYFKCELASAETEFAPYTRGGDDGIRTHDPHVANVMLSQLSYIPTCMCAAAQDGIFGCTLPFVKKALNNSHVNRKSGSQATASPGAVTCDKSGVTAWLPCLAQ